MGGFVDAVLGFPAVIFTVLLVPVVLYWATVLAGALDVDLLGDIGGEGPDVGLDPDADAAVDGGDGALSGWWQALGLAGVPVTIVASLVVLFGWLVALVATAAADVWDVAAVVRLLGGLVTIVVAAAAGALAASVVARPLGRVFATTQAESRTAFVGRTCIVRTAEVTATFGQAEAADPSGATVLVPVRVARQDGRAGVPSLRRDDEALIFDYDPAAEVFLVCPVDDALGAGADGLP
ncbi:MAG: hypothetical protein JXA83_00480 [Acidimicrobiales bacterium]|nr:hypothetical protein [Acidimicrobiales bacterium]